MDLLYPVVRHLTYDAFLRRDGYAVPPHRAALARSQYMSRDELATLQWNRLRAIIRFAAEENPFYRERFRQIGFHPGDLRSFDDLCGLPPLTKEDIRTSLSRSFSHGYTAETTLHKRTGGSTGVPLHVYMDFGAASQKRAAVERHDTWAGWGRGVPLAAVWGNTSGPQKWRSWVRNVLTTRARTLDTLDFSAENVSRFVEYLRTHRPHVLFGHAHSIFRLAEFAATCDGPPIELLGIITSAMTLSPLERRRIEETFRCPVFNRYGSEEVSLIASECERHEGLHIFAEGVLLEYGEPIAPGLPRTLLVTDLLNRAMPLIRYEIGDLGILEDRMCGCGRGLPLLKEVSGRTADFLYAPDGRPVFGISILDTFMIHIRGIRQAQIVQDRHDHLLVRLVPDHGYDCDAQIGVGEVIRRNFGPEMKWTIDTVEEIERTGAGKYRFSICALEERSGPCHDAGQNDSA